LSGSGEAALLISAFWAVATSATVAVGWAAGRCKDSVAGCSRSLFAVSLDQLREEACSILSTPNSLKYSSCSRVSFRSDKNSVISVSEFIKPHDSFENGLRQAIPLNFPLPLNNRPYRTRLDPGTKANHFIQNNIRD